VDDDRDDGREPQATNAGHGLSTPGFVLRMHGDIDVIGTDPINRPGHEPLTGQPNADHSSITRQATQDHPDPESAGHLTRVGRCLPGQTRDAGHSAQGEQHVAAPGVDQDPISSDVQQSAGHRRIAGDERPGQLLIQVSA
jgi:hypothetical protein